MDNFISNLITTVTRQYASLNPSRRPEPISCTPLIQSPPTVCVSADHQHAIDLLNESTPTRSDHFAIRPISHESGRRFLKHVYFGSYKPFQQKLSCKLTHLYYIQVMVRWNIMHDTLRQRRSAHLAVYASVA